MAESFYNMGSISSLTNNLTKIEYDPTTEELFFRGHYDSEYKLLPGIYRQDKNGNLKYIDKEDRLFKELIRSCPGDFNECETTFEELVKMQHYSLPTRLFDITINPLVALFFACYKSDTESKKDRLKPVNGEVVIFKVKKDRIKYFDSDSVSVVSNIARRPSGFEIPLKDDGTAFSDAKEDVEEFNKEGVILYLLHEIKREKPHFLNLIDPLDLERVFCVKPKLNNPRIIRQGGAFLLFGINKLKNNPAELDNSITISRMKVKGEEKETILKQLAMLGISEGTLLPELDRVSHYLSNSIDSL